MLQEDPEAMMTVKDNQKECIKSERREGDEDTNGIIES
jgi:hypothetical protein